MNHVNLIFSLLLVFQIKHFLADYPLQTPYMLRKFLPDHKFILPLTCHSLVHAILTYLIALPIRSDIALNLAIFDFTIHFIMDRIKASPKMLGRFESLDKTCFVGVFKFATGDFKSMKLDNCLTDAEKKDKVEWGKNRLKENKYFWWSLGLDQMVHHITHYIIIYFLVK